MPDVVGDEKRWRENVDKFKKFSRDVAGEFELRTFENGKEVVLVRQFYRPVKGE